MPLQIIRNDITKIKVDAIVNAAKASLLGGGGVDGAIHHAAGPNLLEECRALGGCKTGQAKITKGYDLPCKYVIHTVGPIWQGGNSGEKQLLEYCYKNSLVLAMEKGMESIAFPLISSGFYGYPKDKALKVAMDVLSDFLLYNDMLIYVVIFDKDSYKISEKLFSDIEEYIDETYVDDHVYYCSARLDRNYTIESDSQEDWCDCRSISLEDAVNQKLKCIDESFTEMLLRKIDENGITDAQCYKKANIDRKLFSKIRSDKYYKPSKPTAIAFAIALELPLQEAENMLKRAGFALSHSNKFDIIIEYFITRGDYDIHKINEALFAFDQSLLGV